MAKKLSGSKPIGIEPQKIIDRNSTNRQLETDSFFLSLAMVFNDIKGLVLLENAFLEVYERPAKEISFHAGEWNGVKIQIAKYSTALLHEAFNLIRENRAIIDSQIFQKYLSQLSKKDQRIWQSILIHCELRPKETASKQVQTFCNFLEQIRNNITFHYYQSGKSLILGYRQHFYKETGIGTEKAYYSYDPSFYGTRFFYADASVKGLLNAKLMDPGKVFTKFLEIGKLFSELLIRYLQDNSHKKK